MVKYILKRILLALFILLGFSILLYALVRCMPVNWIETKYYSTHSQTESSAEDLMRIKALYGLDDESFLGVLKGYWSWLTAFIGGDMGKSFKYNQPVSTVIADHMGVSFAISFIALILELIIAVPLGIKCACKQYSKLDYVVTVLVMIGISFPSFFLGKLMIKWFSVDLGWFESGGLTSSTHYTGIALFGDMAWHLFLPLFVLVVLSIGSLVRYTRTNTLEVLSADYIRTARAKGLSEGSVVYKHVFKNTMIPFVTMLAGTLPGLFSGSMITETVFDIPGIGNIAYQAMVEGDIPFIMGYNMFIAVLTVIGILLSDLMYAVVDPRVKLGK